MTTPYPAPLPEAPLSVNIRIPEVPGAPQFTLRAADGATMEHLSSDVARHAAGIGRYLTEFRAGLLASVGVEAVAAAPQAAPQQTAAYQPPQYGPKETWAPVPAPAAPQGPPGVQAPTCPHGVREYKSGVSKQGKPYKMWACPETNRDAQCKPEWA